jgi:hypothetical protein
MDQSRKVYNQAHIEFTAGTIGVDEFERIKRESSEQLIKDWKCEWGSGSKTLSPSWSMRKSRRRLELAIHPFHSSHQS